MGFKDWLAQALLSDLPRHRRLSYFALGSALGLTLATGQFVAPVKVVLFYDLVGAEMDPVAKSWLLIVLLPLLFLYGLLVSVLPGPKSLVVTISSIYAIIYSGIALAMFAASGSPSPWVAWVLYYATETKGVIVMPMLWSVVAEVSTTELSRQAYPFIFAVIQAGGILGSIVAIKVRSFGGPVYLLVLQAVIFLVVAFLNYIGCAVLASAQGDALLEDAKPLSLRNMSAPQMPSKVREAPFHPSKVFRDGLEGLWLLLSRPFAFGIFWVSYAALVPRTVLDYASSVLIVGHFSDKEDSVAFLGHVSLCQNIAILVLTLLGTRPIVKFLGVGLSLFILPVALLGCILALCIRYSFWMAIIAVVTASIVAYGLNSPCKEMLFVRTSRDIKYKAKSWSEMYGNNFMKLLGSQINLWFNRQSDACAPDCFQSVPTGVLTAMWVSLWIGVVCYVNKEYKRLDLEDTIVE